MTHDDRAAEWRRLLPNLCKTQPERHNHMNTDMSYENLTPQPLYAALCQAIYAAELALDNPDTPTEMLDTIVATRDSLMVTRAAFRQAVAAS